MLIILAVFCQCKNAEKGSSHIQKIVISPSEAHEIKTSQLFTSADMIELKSDDSLVYVKPTKLVVKNNKYYFKSKNMIIVYDSCGNYDSSLFKKGNGPGEYINISDFHIEDNGNIVINDREGRKLMYYTGNGQFLKSINHGLLSYIFFKKKNKIYLNSGNLMDAKYRVNLLDEKNSRITATFLKQEESMAYLSVIEYTNFSFFEDTLSYSHTFSNTIYQLKENEAIPRIEIDFGKNNLPDDFVTEYQDLRTFMDAFQKSNYASRIDGYHEGKNFLFFLYSFQNTRSFVWVSKQHNLIYNFNRIEDDLLFPEISHKTSYNLLPICINDDYLYVSIEAFEFIDLYNQIKEKMSVKEWNGYIKKRPDIERIYSNIREDSNALILRYKQKK